MLCRKLRQEVSVMTNTASSLTPALSRWERENVAGRFVNT